MADSTPKALKSSAPEICERATRFAERVVKCCQALYKVAGVEKPMLTQLLKSGTSIGANLQEAQSGESRADFVHKVNIALKESRETGYWLRLIRAAKLVPPKRLDSLLDEAEQIRKVLGAISRATKAKTKVPNSEFRIQNSELSSRASP